MHEWIELTKLTGGSEFLINRVTVIKSGISIEGEFEPPPVAKLSYEDQVFIAMFIRHHGSIKKMEQIFGVSYPTIKNRLNLISEKIGLVEMKVRKSNSEILNLLEKGEITPKEAKERMSGQ